MPRLFLTVVVGLVVLVATFAVMVAASVDADPPHYGMDTILNGTHAATHTPLLAETNTVTVSRASSDSGTFEPIRIGTFFDSLYIPSMYCSSASDKVEEHDTLTILCSESAILTDAKRDVLINELVPAAVKLLEERLLVRRRAGPIKVPAYGPETHCGNFAIPNTHRTDGVSGYDVIFHVAAKPTTPGVEAWVFQCTNASDGDQRALVVALNVDPRALDDATDMGVRTVVREMIHGLGFTSDNFQKRGLLGKQTVRGKPDTLVLLANDVLQPILEEHFQCPNVQYMELATNDIGQLVWTDRTMNDDIMTNFDRSGYISAITLGALEATGAYRGVYKKAEVSPWGRGSGCAFLDEPCLTNKVALPNTQFCTNTDFSFHCSPTRRAVAQCDSWTHQPSETWASGYGLWSANPLFFVFSLLSFSTAGFNLIFYLPQSFEYYNRFQRVDLRNCKVYGYRDSVVCYSSGFNLGGPDRLCFRIISLFLTFS